MPNPWKTQEEFDRRLAQADRDVCALRRAVLELMEAGEPMIEQLNDRTFPELEPSDKSTT